MKILTFLTTDKDTLKAKQALRKAKALKRNQERLIDALEDKRHTQISKVESLESITVETVDVDTWADKYHKSKVALILIEQEIKVAKQTFEELFTDEIQETNA